MDQPQVNRHVNQLLGYQHQKPLLVQTMTETPNRKHAAHPACMALKTYTQNLVRILFDLQSNK